MNGNANGRNQSSGSRYDATSGHNNGRMAVSRTGTVRARAVISGRYVVNARSTVSARQMNMPLFQRKSPD